MSDKILYALARPLLFSLDPEAAHNLTLPSLKRAADCGITKLIARPQADPRTVMGLTFPNPVGLAAGLDKDALSTITMNSPGYPIAEGAYDPVARLEHMDLMGIDQVMLLPTFCGMNYTSIKDPEAALDEVQPVAHCETDSVVGQPAHVRRVDAGHHRVRALHAHGERGGAAGRLSPDR